MDPVTPQAPATPGERNLSAQSLRSVRAYVESGTPWVWITAASIATSVIVVVSLLLLIASRGMPYFWPADVVVASYQEPDKPVLPVMGCPVEDDPAHLGDAKRVTIGKNERFDRTLLISADDDDPVTI